MGAAEVWGGLAGAAILLVAVYLSLLVRALRNERVIGIAIDAMKASLASEPAPQRALLSSIADTLGGQEQAASRIEMKLHQLTRGDSQTPPADELLEDLLGLPEPQVLITNFLREYGGGPGSGTAFAFVASDLVQLTAAEVFADLADGHQLDLERLLLLAGAGNIATVALAGCDVPTSPGPPLFRAPRVAELDPAAAAAIARDLDRAISRQLRLVTLLHGQAEAMLRRQLNGRSGRASRGQMLRHVLSFPLPRQPKFQAGDLQELVVALDAVGEVVDMAREHMGRGEQVAAVRLLAGVRVPVPAGLPGRLYHQELLAQARPLAALGVWHRLAVSRWSVSIMEEIGRGAAAPGARSAGFAHAPGVPASWVDGDI